MGKKIFVKKNHKKRKKIGKKTKKKKHYINP